MASSNASPNCVADVSSSAPDGCPRCWCAWIGPRRFGARPTRTLRSSLASLRSSSPSRWPLLHTSLRMSARSSINRTRSSTCSRATIRTLKAAAIRSRALRRRSEIVRTRSATVFTRRIFCASFPTRAHPDAQHRLRIDLHGGKGFMSDAAGLRYRKIPLNNGADESPALGFGTLIPDPVATKEAVRISLEAGFRQFDCAERYRNEEQVGEAMRAVFKEGKVKRKDVFVGTKLWNNNHRPERVKPAFEASLKRLQLDYVDLYLIHTPFAFQPGDEQDPRDANGNVIYDKGVTLLDTWRALERLVDEGRCKAIGLSDVGLDQTKEIFEAARIKPAVVHVESHPYLPQWELLDYCRTKGIVLQAFAALGQSSEPNLLEDPVVTAIARRINKTPAQVLLAWAIQRGTALLTTSKTPSRIKENFAISALPEEAVREISEGIQLRVRFNPVVETGVPGFFPSGKR